ncbi:MAG TPA: hypothetical protein DCR14_16845, partial [Acidimicrobiaceae bacterium]|nr:hypothetical protein [Acidimicrobiaceae bacterium]
GVSGRGAISAAPATLLDSQGEQRVSAWAGPWPVEEHWWDTARARRMARLQVLTDAGRLVLLALEGGQWWLTAEYA